MKKNMKKIGYTLVALLAFGAVLSFSSIGKTFAAQGNGGASDNSVHASGKPAIIHRGGGHQYLGRMGIAGLIDGVAFDALSPDSYPAVFEKPDGISLFSGLGAAKKADNNDKQEKAKKQSFLTALGTSWVGGDMFIGVPRDPSGDKGFDYHGAFSSNNNWNITYTPFGAPSFTVPFQKVNVWRSIGLQEPLNSSDGNVLATNLIHDTENDQVCVNKDGSLVICGSFACTGNTPDSHSVMCQGDNTGLTVNTPKTLVAACTTDTKCEFECMGGYHYDANTQTCVEESNNYQWQVGDCGICAYSKGICTGTWTYSGPQTCIGDKVYIDYSQFQSDHGVPPSYHFCSSASNSSECNQLNNPNNFDSDDLNIGSCQFTSNITLDCSVELPGSQDVCESRQGCTWETVTPNPSKICDVYCTDVSDINNPVRVDDSFCDNTSKPNNRQSCTLSLDQINFSTPGFYEVENGMVAVDGQTPGGGQANSDWDQILSTAFNNIEGNGRPVFGYYPAGGSGSITSKFYLMGVLKSEYDSGADPSNFTLFVEVPVSNYTAPIFSYKTYQYPIPDLRGVMSDSAYIYTVIPNRQTLHNQDIDFHDPSSNIIQIVVSAGQPNGYHNNSSYIEDTDNVYLVTLEKVTDHQKAIDYLPSYGDSNSFYSNNRFYYENDLSSGRVYAIRKIEQYSGGKQNYAFVSND